MQSINYSTDLLMKMMDANCIKHFEDRKRQSLSVLYSLLAILNSVVIY